MATIITKNSQTASAVPDAASLSVGELAVNTADGKLYTEHTGGVVKEIIPSTVVDGGITTAKIADSAVTSAKIADGTIATGDIADSAVTTAKLSNSGVTAGTYGSSSVVPVVTVDAKGRLTSVSTASIASSAPTTAQVLSATAGASGGAVGTYLLAVKRTNVATQYNNTQSGSDLFPSECTGNSNAGSLSGTWRCMGYSNTWTGGCSTTQATTVWLRIS